MTPPTAASVPVVGSLTSVPEAVARLGVDTVAVTASRGLTSGVLKRLGWDLEGAGVDLVVAPALTDVAGPRVHVRPVSGLQLLYVEQPEFTGPTWAIKEAFDRVTRRRRAASLLSPLLGADRRWRCGSTSRGPVIFRQVRVGRDGDEFTVYKFRTMVVDAETPPAGRSGSATRATASCSRCQRRPAGHPRSGGCCAGSASTSCRSWSTSLLGDMSLVGPRPALPTEAEQLRPGHGPPAAGQAGHHRPVAGERPVRPVLGGQRPARPLLRRELVVRRRHPDPLEDPVRGGPRPRRLLTGRPSTGRRRAGAGRRLPSAGERPTAPCPCPTAWPASVWTPPWPGCSASPAPRPPSWSAAGDVLVDGAPAGKSDRVHAGAWLDVDDPAAARARRVVVAEPVPGMVVVHDDDDIVVVDKPVGVAAHPSPGWTGPTVVGGLAGAGYRISTSGCGRAPGHRAPAGRRHQRPDGRRQVRARLHRAQAGLQGAHGRQDLPRARPGPPGPADAAPSTRPSTGTRAHDYKWAVVADGKPSVTHYDTLEAHRAASLLEITLETGRTHQIRVHMAALRHPCVGDLTYGADPTLAARLGPDAGSGCTRCGSASSTRAPGSGSSSPASYPDDLATALERLRAES